MKPKTTIYRLTLLAAASVLITWTMAYAASRKDQQNQNQQNWRNQQNWNQQQNQQNRMQQQNNQNRMQQQQGTQPWTQQGQNQQQNQTQQGRSSQQQQQNAQGRRVVIDPETWIRVGYDFDNDGRTDAYEYILGYDLSVARSRSATRQGRPNAVAGRLRQQQTVTGTVQDMKQIKLAGVQQDHVLVKISSNGRTVRADLGARDQIDPLNIKKGDQITVQGVSGSINNKRMIMATEIETQDKSTRVHRTKGPGSLRFQGTIDKLKEVKLEKNQSAPKHLVALVELDSGKKVPLDLGRTTEHQQKNLKFSTGDDLIFIARPARVKGKTILTAEKISIDGNTYDVDWVKQARSKMRQQGSQQQQNQQQWNQQQPTPGSQQQQRSRTRNNTW